MAEQTPKVWRLETKADIDGGTYQAWTDEPTAGVERGAKAIVSEEGIVDWGTLSERLRDHPRGLSRAALAAALDVKEMARVVGKHSDSHRTYDGGTWCDCGTQIEPPYVQADPLALNRHIAEALRAAILGEA